MKATFEFYLPEEEQQYNQAMRAGEYAAALGEFQRYIKHAEDVGDCYGEQAKEVLDAVREKWTRCTENIDWRDIPW